MGCGGWCVYEYRSLHRSEEGAEFLGDGVTKGFEPPIVVLGIEPRELRVN